MRSLSNSRFSLAISSARSPRAIRDSGQSARSRLLEKTILGISFIGAAYSWLEVGQYEAISSYVFRPMRCAPASQIQSSLAFVSSGSSGGSSPPSITGDRLSPLGTATKPSSEMPIMRTIRAPASVTLRCAPFADLLVYLVMSNRNRARGIDFGSRHLLRRRLAQE